jgi:hypothetical protein
MDDPHGMCPAVDHALCGTDKRRKCLFFATLGAVDKVEISTAALYGFRSDNHLVGQQYSWVGSIVSIGVGRVSPLAPIMADRANTNPVYCGHVPFFVSGYAVSHRQIYGLLLSCLVNCNFDVCRRSQLGWHHGPPCAYGCLGGGHFAWYYTDHGQLL